VVALEGGIISPACFLHVMCNKNVLKLIGEIN
jgi:hypothetical protein